MVLSLLVAAFLISMGIYLSAEGFLNILYWRPSHPPWLFQAGRILRGLIGVSMIIVGLMH
ncbi:MAG: hypothetical protein WB643_11270 [Candidatus Bathyarchaeia archaeon]